MHTLIIGGGDLTASFLTAFMKRTKIDFIIAADRGMECLAETGISPNLILGDYDSTDPALFEVLKQKAIEQGIDLVTYPAEKDFSDMEAAMLEAVKRGSEAIWILGATGGRLDHFLSNLMNLEIGLKEDIPAFILDEQNLIFLADHPLVLRWKEDEKCLRIDNAKAKERTCSVRLDRKPKYLSFLPMGDRVEHLTLTGTKYPLQDHGLGHRNTSLTISNEMEEDEVAVAFDEGVLAVLLTKDRA